jgi:hypothetical protein
VCTSNGLLRFLAAFVAATLCAVAADAAEIRADPSDKGDLGIVLEGKIEPGDFDKLRTFIFQGEGGFKIYLASPGGDLAEAMKIGRLVRLLKMATIVPERPLSDELFEKLADRHGLEDPKANYMCVSACFFVFVAGIQRESDLFQDAILGVHRPYVSEKDLQELSGDQAIAAANQTRSIVDSYLKEMGVPAKYADQMFSVPKDEVEWISKSEFETDFAGFIPELKDWVDTRCDKRTAAEKSIWEALKDKRRDELPAAENLILDQILKESQEQYSCEIDIQLQLALDAYKDALENGVGRH